MLYLYFIQVGEDGPIKIGIAGDPVRRLEALQSGNPIGLRILATRPGALELERDLHARFAAWRIRGEWFAPDAHGLREEIELAKQIEDERYVSRQEQAEVRERIETRAVQLVREGRWDEAQALVVIVPPEGEA